MLHLLSNTAAFIFALGEDLGLALNREAAIEGGELGSLGLGDVRDTSANPNRLGKGGLALEAEEGEGIGGDGVSAG